LKNPDELVEKMAAHRREYEDTIKELRSKADGTATTSRLTLKVAEELAKRLHEQEEDMLEVKNFEANKLLINSLLEAQAKLAAVPRQHGSHFDLGKNLQRLFDCINDGHIEPDSPAMWNMEYTARCTCNFTSSWIFFQFCV
jgi:hypothetical protein